MKQRVALIATCLNLVLCIAFLWLCAIFSQGTMNEGAQDSLAAICRLSVRVTDSAAFDREETLRALRSAVSGSAMVGLIYQADGQIDFSSRPTFKDALTADEVRTIQSGKLHTATRLPHSGDGDVWLYAFESLPNGDTLAVAREGYTILEAMGGKLVLLVLLAVLVALVCAIILQFAVNKTNIFVGEVQRVLEDFSEGRFDSRIKSASGDTLEQSAHFNEVMGRIQDRVFKQKTRNQALNTVINHMQNGILAVDDKLNIILVTPAAKHLLNIVGSSEGLPISTASKDVNLDKVLTDAMHQGGVYTNEVAARSAVGRGHVPLRLYVSPMMKDGKAVGAVALVEDITELRRLEQVRTDFAANVSHELKTPLTSIKGFVETLQEGAIDNPAMAKKFLRIIMLEADRLTRLINDILSITKLESGKDDMPSQKIRLDRMAQDVCDMLEFQASEKNVTIFPPQVSEPSVIVGNPDRVEQMLINLIENAVKYNHEGGSVTVTMHNSGDTVNVSISDTGIGIAEENLPRLFERFYRVDKGRSRSMGGTGLGLAIVKHLIRTMGGMIEVQSKLSEGTEFLITLPRVVGEVCAEDFDEAE